MSVIVQITVFVPTGYVSLASVVPLKLFVMLTRPQLSLVPVGSGTVTAAVHAFKSFVVVMLAGQVITGASASLTMIVCAHAAVLPSSPSPSRSPCLCPPDKWRWRCRCR